MAWLMEHPEIFMLVECVVLIVLFALVTMGCILLGFSMGRKTLILPGEKEKKPKDPGPAQVERKDTDPWEAAMQDTTSGRIPTINEGHG